MLSPSKSTHTTHTTQHNTQHTTLRHTALADVDYRCALVLLPERNDSHEIHIVGAGGAHAAGGNLRYQQAYGEAVPFLVAPFQALAHSGDEGARRGGTGGAPWCVCVCVYVSVSVSVYVHVCVCV